MNPRPIHPLEEFTRDTFGDGFAMIILRGLDGEIDEGDEEYSLSCERDIEEDLVVRTTFSIITPLAKSAGRYKPLVLAALFKLLLSRTELSCHLNFTFKEVLGELIWPDTDACRVEIDQALEYHLACRYLRSDEAVDGSFTGSSSRVLISSYTRGESPRPQSERFTEEQNRVTLDQDLINSLREGEIVFAEIFFGRLAGRGVGQVSEASLAAPATDKKRGGGTRDKEHDSGLPEFSHPRIKPTIQIKKSPVSRRSADHRPKILARPIGQTEISINTGTIASTILRALNLTTARHPVSIPPTPLDEEDIAEKVYREVDRRTQFIARALVKEVRSGVFEDVVRDTYGLLHLSPPKRPAGERGPKSPWHSPEHLRSALRRAIEAIEFENWKPKKKRVTVNRRWKLENVHIATIKMVAAYWSDKKDNAHLSEAEKVKVGEFDSSQMKKWLQAQCLPGFSILRSELRLEISGVRANQQLLKACGGNLLFLALFRSLLLPEN